MVAPLNPPRNVGPITYTITASNYFSGRMETKSYTANWPYFAYDTRGRNALQRQAMSALDYNAAYGHFKSELTREGPTEVKARALASVIQAALDKFDRDAAFKASADRKAANDAAYAAAAARTYAEMNASTLPTTVITLGSTTPQPIKAFTTNKFIPATKVVVTTATKNSQKFLNNKPKNTGTTQQSSPGKGTPNKNPPIPPPPPPPPDIHVSLCLPGTYLDIKTGKCVPCPIGKQYIRGSGCQPCPPGSVGESIHTGCTSVGPDGRSYTMIA